MELIRHHTLKNVALVIDVMEDISPKHVQLIFGHQETADAHPQPVRKGRQSECDDEDGSQRRQEHDKGLGAEEVKEEVKNPAEEGRGCGREVREEVSGKGKEDYNSH